MKHPRLILAAVVVLGAAYAGYHYWTQPATDSLIDNLDALLDLPPNRWVKYHNGGTDGWTRQGHAGMTYDTERGTLVIFGSDTHGQNWDNAVHAFHPLARRWQTHQAESSPDDYRVDAHGRPVVEGGAPGAVAGQPSVWESHVAAGGWDAPVTVWALRLDATQLGHPGASPVSIRVTPGQSAPD